MNAMDVEVQGVKVFGLVNVLAQGIQEHIGGRPAPITGPTLFVDFNHGATSSEYGLHVLPRVNAAHDSATRYRGSAHVVKADGAWTIARLKSHVYNPDTYKDVTATVQKVIDAAVLEV